MLRIKVIVCIALAFALAAGLVYLNETRTVTAVTTAEAGVRLAQAQVSLEQRRSLRNFSVLERAKTIARFSAISSEILRLKAAPAVDAKADEKTAIAVLEKRLVDVHQALERELAATIARYKSQADVKDRGNLEHRIKAVPDYVAVVDEAGRVLAEKGTYVDKWDRIETRILSVVSNPKNIGALDVWFMGDTPLTVGLAPIVSGGSIIGGIIVGQSLNNETKADRDALGIDVVLRVRGKNTQGDVREFIRTTVTNGMTDSVEKFFAKAELGGRANIRRQEIANGDQSRTVVYQRLAGVFLSADMMIGVLLNTDDIVKQASESHSMIFVACFLGALLAIGLCLVILANFFRPIEALDQGILELLNGNLDFWFDPDSEEMTSRMAQNLNILVCQLSGRPLPPEEDSVGAAEWANDQLFVEDMNLEELVASNTELPSGDSPSGTYSLAMLRVLKDPDDVYLRKTFSDYVEALEKSGQPRRGLTFQIFETEMDKKSARIRQRFECKELRFIVEVENGRASLRPVPVG